MKPHAKNVRIACLLAALAPLPSLHSSAAERTSPSGKSFGARQWRLVFLAAGLGCWLWQAGASAGADRVRFDFESGGLQGWRVVEGWFENPVTERAVIHNQYREVPGNRYNKQGAYFDDFSASGRTDLAATEMRFAQRRPWLLDGALPTVSTDPVRSLRAAIEDLTAGFGSRYPRGAEYVKRLDALEPMLAEESGREAAQEFARLQREALVANPLVGGQPILFVVRPQYRSSFHAIDTLFHTDEANPRDFEGGGALKLIDFARDGATRTAPPVMSRDLLESPALALKDGGLFTQQLRVSSRKDRPGARQQRDGSWLTK
jgi:hypothetical protein